MKIDTPNGDELFIAKGTSKVGEIQRLDQDDYWISISAIGSTGVIIDTTEWSAFVNLVNEMDKSLTQKG